MNVPNTSANRVFLRFICKYEDFPRDLKQNFGGVLTGIDKIGNKNVTEGRINKSTLIQPFRKFLRAI